MEETFKPLVNLFTNFSWRSLIPIADILVVAYLIYRLLVLVRGSRAWRVVAGVMIFMLMLFVSDKLQLTTMHWILDKATLLAPVSLVILLLPELRQAIEGFGKLGHWTQRLVGATDTVVNAQAQTVEEIVAATAEMSASRTGALMVLERGTPLEDIVANGMQLEARVSAPLLVAIFYEGNPLHDGAVVIRGDKLVAGACRLPSSESPLLSPHMHMRHRAGVGVTEVFDCVAVIVSEERGTIGIAVDGDYTTLNNQGELRDALNREWRQVSGEPGSRRERKPLFGRRGK